MRLPACLASAPLILILAPTLGRAQVGHTAPWRFGVLVESLHFSRSLIDGSAPASEAAGLRPSGGVGLGVAVARAGPSWRAEVTATWAGVRPQADNASVAVTDKTARLTRWRLGAAAERRLGAVGTGMLGLGAGPALDWWRIAGESRVRIGGQAALALRLPLSGWELENRLGVGVSASPFVPEDAGAEFETRALVSLFLGMVVRAPL
jgi:hypothetical protein